VGGSETGLKKNSNLKLSWKIGRSVNTFLRSRQKISRASPNDIYPSLGVGGEKKVGERKIYTDKVRLLSCKNMGNCF